MDNIAGIAHLVHQQMEQLRRQEILVGSMIMRLILGMQIITILEDFVRNGN